MEYKRANLEYVMISPSRVGLVSFFLYFKVLNSPGCVILIGRVSQDKWDNFKISVTLTKKGRKLNGSLVTYVGLMYKFILITREQSRTLYFRVMHDVI